MMLRHAIIAPELHDPMIQVLIICNTVDASVRDHLGK